MEITGDGVTGRFPAQRLPLLFEWRDVHREELLENWTRLRNGQPPEPIPALRPLQAALRGQPALVDATLVGITDGLVDAVNTVDALLRALWVPPSC